METSCSSSSDTLKFYINGQAVEVTDPDPRTLLVDFLRSPQVGLTGTKKSCGQGGCGACTVMLSEYNPKTQQVEHHSINSCLKPICALDGKMITTTEGIGSVDTAVDPVQYKIAECNGTQCGYCTPGWVMNMKSFLTSNQGKELSAEQINNIFDGNLCRCTGFRPILYAMRQFAAEPSSHNAQDTPPCIIDPAEKPKCENKVISFPEGLKKPPRQVSYLKNNIGWFRPTLFSELETILSNGIDPDSYKLTVGNTSYGIYNEYPLDQADYYNPLHYIDISAVSELHDFTVQDQELYVGAATTYSQFLNQVETLQQQTLSAGKQQTLAVLHYMAHRTAGMIVRNAASLAGNTMLVLNHINKGTPFPSDLFTALAMLGADLDLLSKDARHQMPLLQYAEIYAQDAELSKHCMIIGYQIPMLSDSSIARCYKVALRPENSHSIVNAGISFEIDQNLLITQARVVFGGIAPLAFRAVEVERVITNQTLNSATLSSALMTLKKEILLVFEKYQQRMAGVPNEGFSNTYKLHLAESYLYQHFVHCLNELAPQSVPSDIKSAGERYERPLSHGSQSWESYPSEFPVNQPVIKLEAFMQATGEAKYNQDFEPNVSGYLGAWVNANQAYAKISYQIPTDNTAQPASIDELKQHLAEKYSGYIDYVTYVDIPNQDAILQGSGKDDPIFVKDEVTSYGQSIGIVLTKDEALAQQIAYYIGTQCIYYDVTGKDPLLTIDQALQQGRVFEDCPPQKPSGLTHIWKITRADSNLDWSSPESVSPHCEGLVQASESVQIDGVDCYLIKGTQQTGAQLHFYMGPQAAVAIPQSNNKLLIYPDSQSPDSIQSSLMETLNIKANMVDVRVPRVAGGYGGKTTRSPFVANPIAVAAWKHKRPVKLVMRRENDTSMVGHRHPTLTNYQIAVGNGNDDPANLGKIMGLKVDWWFNGGNTYDCSFTVMDCMQLRTSSGYYVPNYQSSGDVAKTNISSNTAYRAFGMIQGLVGLEDAIEAAAHQLNIRPEQIREKNLYQLGQTTPYGQPLNYLYLDKVWQYTKQKSDFDNRLQAVEKFNQQNKWVKRGISIIPILYGSGYNATFLEQGGALIEVYSQDGTVILRQGGVDMGQGLNTKVAQVTAEALNIPLDYVQVGEVDTQVVPNPISTGASTGSAYNGGAAKQAGQVLKDRLMAYCDQKRQQNGEKWCQENGFNYWSYEDGWKHDYKGSPMWANIVGNAYFDRINLSAQVRFRQAGGSGVDSGLSFHKDCCTETVNYFVGFTFSAACSEVEVDILTGVMTVLRSDIVYDVGKSLNPALDIGQIEGGFIQGLGYITTEELVYENDGPNKGRLNTQNTWRYKPPAHTSIPLQMNVDLFPRQEAKVKSDPNLLFGAKEVGEPPLVLATTVYFAAKQAVLSAREEQGINGWFRMDTPLTPQRLREACQLDTENIKI